MMTIFCLEIVVWSNNKRIIEKHCLTGIKKREMVSQLNESHWTPERVFVKFSF